MEMVDGLCTVLSVVDHQPITIVQLFELLRCGKERE